MTIDEVGLWLEKLGAMATADDVAAYLRSEHITGGVSAWSCPIATFLHVKVPGAYSVTESEVVATTSDGCERGQFTNPEAVSRFVHRYDCGHFPDLRMIPFDDLDEQCTCVHPELCGCGVGNGD